MDPLPPKKGNPEAVIQKAIIVYLEHRNWFVKPTHGNMYQSGLPDLFCCHNVYGQKWVEVKLPNMKGSKFTNAQQKEFPKFVTHGSPIWVLTGATKAEYDKLFKPGNLWVYMAQKM